MKKLFQLIFSISATGFFLIVFAVALAVATFIENSYGSEAARAIVYNSWWLELILIILAMNLIANVIRFKLYKPQKLTLGIFHLAFILILIGAGITRYFGKEGEMHIREGNSSSVMQSQDTWFQVKAEYNGEKKEASSRFLVTSISKKQIDKNLKIKDREIKIKSIDYLPQAHQEIEPANNGNPVVEIAYPLGGVMQSQIIQSGTSADINGITMGLNSPAQVEFSMEGDSLEMSSKDTVFVVDMSGGPGNVFTPGIKISSKEKIVYKVGKSAFLIKQFLPSAKVVVAPGGEEGEGAVILQISDKNSSETIPVWVDAHNKKSQYYGNFNGVRINTWIGPNITVLPFTLTLKDFVLERYPGSNSPSSYESLVTLSDKDKGIQKDFRIYMNNVLKHRGYRFYQSSYDTDEKGSILSVNNDPWGTFFTYLGYFFLFLGILLSIFNPKSYFIKLMKRVSAGTALLILFLAGGSLETKSAVPNRIPDDIASDFSRVWVQGHEGRIKPFSTLAYEVVMKVARNEKIAGQTPEQVVLGMAAHPGEWQTVPMISVSENELTKKLGVTGKDASFADFFDAQGTYKLSSEIQTAYSKNPAQRNKLDNAVIKVDERLNVVYQLYNGNLFRFFPSHDPKDDTWYTPSSKLPSSVSSDSVFIRTSFQKFLGSLNNKAEAESIISGIINYQEKYGTELIPGKTKGNLEVIYNHVNIFKDLSYWYSAAGLVLLILFFNSLFTGKPLRKKGVNITVTLLLIGFTLHCAGLVIRGYISRHMPWSNGYESMIYIAWTGMLAGLIFARRNPMVLGAAAILSGLTLFVAQMSWLNPEITNLVPVLKSYWLTIHVAIITASYGFLGVSAIIGILNLLLADFQNPDNRQRVNTTIIRMTAINQASMILGLYFLTIGTLVGGIWANESWGRYWGWDPKETWSLITILVYTFITHMRWIPGSRGWFAVNLGSVTGLISVLMTYLGVNYYLSGLHSYGSGEGLQFPVVLVIVFVIIGIIAFFAKKRGNVTEQDTDLQG
jgi:cytochrome c-type biogenesis protein CcsB